MNEVFFYSLQAVQDKVINDKHCFELYGYDVLFDSELRAWLIEVNASPSFNTSSDEDKQMKMNVLDDTFNVIDMEKRLSGDENRVGGFDLITGVFNFTDFLLTNVSHSRDFLIEVILTSLY